MMRLPRKSGLLPNLLLAALLLSAQFGSLLHAFEHDAGAPQGQYCPTCVTASQLSFACIDTQADQAIVPVGDHCLAEHDTDLVGTSPVLVHQRGPPLPL